MADEGTDGPVGVRYGATLDGVRGLLPHRTLNPSTKPSEEHAARWLTSTSGRVATRIRRVYDLLDDEGKHDVDVLAANVVELAVAAMVEDAAYPERAGVADTSYGAVLWTRHREALGDLYAALGIDDGDAGVGSDATVGAPSFVFPEPLFRRDERW